MKKHYGYFMIPIIVLLVLSVSALTLNFRGGNHNMLLDMLNKSTDQVSMQQLKAQVSFFKDALDEFGATSPKHAAVLWAKSEETRNGVFQYAVSCGNLKEQIIKRLGKVDESFWIIGGSSPYVKKYEITSAIKLDDSTYKVTIKYYWATSAGEEEPTHDILTVVKDRNYWCVKEVN